MIVERGRLAACMPFLGEEEMQAITAAWYEAIIGVVPCQHWKTVGLEASRHTKPVDKFTLGQFFEAWASYREQGRAPGYEPWL